ncbi:MAG: glutamine synthetase family protein [Chloroflexi bacterium]|nr:glutamine synthetase family protein [Chloroflexota bacterium]MCI0577632.1 glutamine synthetase family protein [Chloroflexota bacterium]MCI0647585.1 glutamine synthetase family protein [Chloroflexota bacterium]MCI0732168.1 glutamine synthetase family protein [Chloroflexota bacterium]
MSREQVITAANKAHVRLIRFLYCDNGGVIRGKLAHINSLARRLETGIGLTVAMQAMNMLDQLQPVEGMGPVGEIRLTPDPDSFVVLPYAPNSAAMMADMLTLDRQPWGACPRSFLKRMIGRAAEQGFSIQAALENEFSLLRPDEAGTYTPIDTGLCFSSVSMTAAAEVMDDIIAALESQGIAIDAYYPELGHGQHELPVRHAPALRAADNQVWFRETVRNVAHRHGLLASLAPKPMPEQAGNGCHIHWSVWDTAGKNNLLYDPEDRYHLSQMGYHFMAGVLAHLPGLLALTAPSYNSYRRLQPHFWSSAYTAWGPDNREAAVRVASGLWGHEAETANLELKASDPSHNPYLALGGLIAAGLDGVARQLTPGEPALIDPGNYSDEERAERGIERYPTSQAAALDALEQDEVLLEALGPDLSRSYLAVKRSEYQAFAAEELGFEIRHHIYKF